jgi:predicted RND superfamily exporter protein
LEVLYPVCGLIGGAVFLGGLALRADGERLNGLLVAGIALVVVSSLLAVPGAVHRYRWSRSSARLPAERAAVGGIWHVVQFLVVPLLLVLVLALLLN